MTCIVGIEHSGWVTIGGDSAGTSGPALTIRADEKVFIRGAYVFGFTSSFRMGQLIRYRVQLPAPPARRQLDAFMVTDFVDAVRNAFKLGGYLKVENGREDAGTFLVGVRGRLYGVYDDLQVSRYAAGFNAVGCGADLAVGAMYATRNMGFDPAGRVRMALAAAAAFSGAVAPPFRIVAAAAGAEHSIEAMQR